MTGGWTKIPNDAILRAAEVGAAFPVYCLLAMHARDGAECWPSIACMAEATGLHRTTIIRSLVVLREAGWITVEKREGRGSVYTVQTEPTSSKTATGSDIATGSNIATGPVALLHQTGSNIATRKKTKKKKQEKDAPVLLPEGLNTADFQAAWSDWLSYRRERRLTTTPRTLTAQLGKLAGWGPDVAVQSIRASIEAGWQGLFPPKPDATAKPHATQPSPTAKPYVFEAGI